MDEQSDDITFTPEQVEVMVFDIVESVVKDKMYNDHLVQGWIDEICSRISKDLIVTNKPFKYLVSCTIMQKNGAGLHLGYACHWDSVNDNCLVSRWPNERRKDPNARMLCIVTLFAVTH